MSCITFNGILHLGSLFLFQSTQNENLKGPLQFYTEIGNNGHKMVTVDLFLFLTLNIVSCSHKHKQLHICNTYGLIKGCCMS